MVNYLKICIDAALAGGEAISNTTQKKVETKDEPNVGYHAIVGRADFRSQRAILRKIQGLDQKSYFLTEEFPPRNLRNRSLDGEDLQKLADSGCYVIDELDGSSSFHTGHYEWSVSVGFVHSLEFLAGAVYAPKVLNDALFYASRGKGAFLESGNKRKRLRVSQSRLEDSYIAFGPDCFLKKYPKHNWLLTRLGDVARTTNGIGSCALGLGLVASGKIDALIQPLQSPWDYSAGKVLVEEAGGKVLFYQIKDGKITFVRNLKSSHFDPVIRQLGLIAANDSLARKIKRIIVED
ncbi:MAG: hypothetical protein PHF67_03960 [Candidatus Nanoarchaeia archaeon]|nr:hypothetical protein [Candidatus Nanoarchaeia archaeon]